MHYSILSKRKNHKTSTATVVVDNHEVEPTTLDLAAAYASRRFFMAKPGLSNSISDTSMAEVAAGGVAAVTAYSLDPYMDFRRSMQEMVDARDLHVPKDEGGSELLLDYLQELLVTYLSLNPKTTHKYILSAFVDLFVCLLSSSSSSSSSS